MDQIYAKLNGNCGNHEVCTYISDLEEGFGPSRCDLEISRIFGAQARGEHLENVV